MGRRRARKNRKQGLGAFSEFRGSLLDDTGSEKDDFRMAMREQDDFEGLDEPLDFVDPEDAYLRSFLPTARRGYGGQGYGDLD